MNHGTKEVYHNDTRGSAPACFWETTGGRRTYKETLCDSRWQNRIGEPMLYKGVHPNNVVISKKDTDNQLSVFSYTGYAKIGPSLHMHFNQDELFHVAEGRYRFVVGDETMELEAGDTIFLPRRIPHSWIQLTDTGRLLYAVQPAGTLEEFFTEMSRLKKPPTEDEAKKIHLAHGMKLIGPPLHL